MSSSDDEPLTRQTQTQRNQRRQELHANEAALQMEADAITRLRELTLRLANSVNSRPRQPEQSEIENDESFATRQALYAQRREQWLQEKSDINAEVTEAQGDLASARGLLQSFHSRTEARPQTGDSVTTQFTNAINSLQPQRNNDVPKRHPILKENTTDGVEVNKYIKSCRDFYKFETS